MAFSTSNTAYAVRDENAKVYIWEEGTEAKIEDLLYQVTSFKGFGFSLEKIEKTSITDKNKTYVTGGKEYEDIEITVNIDPALDTFFLDAIDNSTKLNVALVLLTKKGGTVISSKQALCEITEFPSIEVSPSSIMQRTLKFAISGDVGDFTEPVA